jgi:hypothetical protein
MNGETYIPPEDLRNPQERAEYARLLSELAERVDELGNTLAEVDFVKVDIDDAMRVHGKIELILGALAIAGGLAVSQEAVHALLQAGPDQFDLTKLFLRLGVAVAAGGGFAAIIQGIRRLETGYKRLHGFIRIRELRKLGD